RLMLTVLAGLAEFERELIRARTGEGRKRAKERGVRFGRPRKLTPHQRQEAIQRLAAGETQADVARTYNVDATTIGRLLGDRPFLGDVSPAAPRMSRVVSAEQAASKCEQPLDRDNLIGAREGQRSGPGLLPIGGVTVPTGLALLWQIYSGRRSLQIHFRQCGHRCGGSRAKSSRMAWRTAGKVG